MQVKTWIVAGLLVVCFVAPWAVAQPTARVTVPFPFFAGPTLMPAGQYECLLDTPYAGTVTLRHVGEPAALVQVTVLTQNIANTSNRARVAFRREGNRYVLYQLWVPGLDHALAVLAETSLAKP